MDNVVGITEAERQQPWFVHGLDPDRRTRRPCSRARWMKFITSLRLVRDAEGNLIFPHPSLFEGDDVMRVGSPEWNEFLRQTVYANGCRMWWEPKPKRQRRRAPSLFDATKQPA